VPQTLLYVYAICRTAVSLRVPPYVRVSRTLSIKHVHSKVIHNSRQCPVCQFGRGAAEGMSRGGVGGGGWGGGLGGEVSSGRTCTCRQNNLPHAVLLLNSSTLVTGLFLYLPDHFPTTFNRLAALATARSEAPPNRKSHVNL
jgi:hypothetical protein